MFINPFRKTTLSMTNVGRWTIFEIDFINDISFVKFIDRILGKTYNPIVFIDVSINRNNCISVK